MLETVYQYDSIISGNTIYVVIITDIEPSFCWFLVAKNRLTSAWKSQNSVKLRFFWYWSTVCVKTVVELSLHTYLLFFTMYKLFHYTTAAGWLL